MERSKRMTIKFVIPFQVGERVTAYWCILDWDRPWLWRWSYSGYSMIIKLRDGGHCWYVMLWYDGCVMVSWWTVLAWLHNKGHMRSTFWLSRCLLQGNHLLSLYLVDFDYSLLLLDFCFFITSSSPSSSQDSDDPLLHLHHPPFGRFENRAKKTFSF